MPGLIPVKRRRFGISPTLRRHPGERACEEIKDLILRSAHQGASRRMAASPCRASTLRDARKSALLRMRSELFHTLERGAPVAPAMLRMTESPPSRRRALLFDSIGANPLSLNKTGGRRARRDRQ